MTARDALQVNPVTRQDVESIVARSLGPNYEPQHYYVESYSNENLGFMAAHRNLVIQVSKQGSADAQLQTYFLKSMPYGLDDQAKFLKDSNMFRREASFFNLIMPELMKSSKDKSWAAQCYLAKHDALVFENLALKGYALRGATLQLESLEAALSSLAKMHGACMLAEKRLGQSFGDMYPELTDELVFRLDGPFADFCRYGIQANVGIAKHLGLDDKLVCKLCNMIYDRLRASQTTTNVLCHGDVWSNNLMFCANNCALVDFQVLRYVPPMVDVSQLLHHNADKQLRDKYEKHLLGHYHEVLSAVLIEGGLPAPPLPQLLQQYDELRIFGLVMINMYFQVNQIPADKQLQYMQTSDGFNNLLFRDRTDLVLQIMKADEAYRQKLSSAIRELLDIAPKYLS